VAAVAALVAAVAAVAVAPGNRQQLICWTVRLGREQSRPFLFYNSALSIHP